MIGWADGFRKRRKIDFTFSFFYFGYVHTYVHIMEKVNPNQRLLDDHHLSRPPFISSTQRSPPMLSTEDAKFGKILFLMPEKLFKTGVVGHRILPIVELVEKKHGCEKCGR
jgi:hypothetical protein